jgi:hypothetical protein
MKYLVFKTFSFDEGDIMFLAHYFEGEWVIEQKYETPKYSGGGTIEGFNCEFMVKAVVKHIAEDMALAALLDTEYRIMDHFTEHQREEIAETHHDLHERNRFKIDNEE